MAGVSDAHIAPGPRLVARGEDLKNLPCGLARQVAQDGPARGEIELFSARDEPLRFRAREPRARGSRLDLLIQNQSRDQRPQLMAAPIAPPPEMSFFAVAHLANPAPGP